MRKVFYIFSYFLTLNDYNDIILQKNHEKGAKIIENDPYNRR